jgi:mRNA interferase RelE/StbE
VDFLTFCLRPDRAFSPPVTSAKFQSVFRELLATTRGIMYQIQYRASARKMLQRMPNNVARTVVGKIEQLAENPYAPNNNIKRLRSESRYRLRVGNWRVLYEIHDDILVIEVIKIGPRGGMYR